MIAILGCADGPADCKQVATVPTRYESFSACVAATDDALRANLDVDSPTIIAQCRSAAGAGLDRKQRARPDRSRHS
ncbi:MAG TPA: hypothetical protein VM308_08550 [Sphingomicrobium sp.]|nr:hypothetical protein [Sphingomicrobium sp.]